MTVKIEYFSDVLCIWAYGGQIRMDELKQEFGDRIEIINRFVPIFGAGKTHVEKNWKDQGGAEGFNVHLQTVAKNWSHIKIAKNLWTEVAPQSSTPAHLYLKAIQLLVEQGIIDNSPEQAYVGRTCFEHAIWLFRDIFFNAGKDVAQRSVQDEVAKALNIPLDKIHKLIDSGEAHAALFADDEARHQYKVPGSPTLVLNDGRQLLYGNVGYRIIDANVRELMHNPEHGEASWC